MARGKTKASRKAAARKQANKRRPENYRASMADALTMAGEYRKAAVMSGKGKGRKSWAKSARRSLKDAKSKKDAAFYYDELRLLPRR